MKIFTRILLAAGLAAVGTQASAQTLYDNFENTRLVTYPVVNGTLTQNTANPGSTTVNSSSTCATYVRSADAYAVVVIKPATKMADVSAYSAGTKKMSIKFRSPAAGLTVQLVMQDGTKNTSAYPTGKYLGDFFATTTKTNDWETLTFSFSAAAAGGYDTTVQPTDINQLVLLVSPNTTSVSTSFIDDIMGPELTTATTTPPTVTTDQLYDNHEGIRVLKYKHQYTGGSFAVDTLNPNVSATGNPSAHVMRYTRSSQQYDGLFIAPVGASLADVSPFLNNTKQMTLRVYSTVAGTKYQITLQDSVKARGAYPAGRHSEYQATTTVVNGWENLVFSLTGRPDTSLPNTGLNELVLLINSGTTTPGKFYLDDWTGPRLTNYVVAATRAQTDAAAFAGPYPNPAAGLAHLPYSLQKPAVVSLALFDTMGRRVASVFDNQARPAGDYSADFSTSSLAPGLYTCRLVVDGTVLSRQLSVQ